MKKFKKTPDEVKREVAQIKKTLAIFKERAQEQGMSFSCLDDDSLAKKVSGETSKSPFITGQSWTSGTAPGSTATYTVHVRNPDPIGYHPVYASIFFGLGNFFEIGDAWTGRDKRWPEFSSDRTFLPANSTHSFSFNYIVPTGLPQGTYNGNTVLWLGSWHDVGVDFDRGSFDLKML